MCQKGIHFTPTTASHTTYISNSVRMTLSFKSKHLFIQLRLNFINCHNISLYREYNTNVNIYIIFNIIII